MTKKNSQYWNTVYGVIESYRVETGIWKPDHLSGDGEITSDLTDRVLEALPQIDLPEAAPKSRSKKLAELGIEFSAWLFVTIVIILVTGLAFKGAVYVWTRDWS